MFQVIQSTPKNLDNGSWPSCWPCSKLCQLWLEHRFGDTAQPLFRSSLCSGNGDIQRAHHTTTTGVTTHRSPLPPSSQDHVSLQRYILLFQNICIISIFRASCSWNSPNSLAVTVCGCSARIQEAEARDSLEPRKEFKASLWIVRQGLKYQY